MTLWSNPGIVMITLLEEMLWNLDKPAPVRKDPAMYPENSTNSAVVTSHERNPLFNARFLAGRPYGPSA